MVDKKTPAGTRISEYATQNGVPEVLLDIVLHNSGDAMCVLKDFAVVVGNQRCLALFGYKDEEFRGLGMADILSPESLVLARERYAVYEAGEIPTSGQTYTCVRKNGEQFTAVVSAISWPADHTIAMAVIRDVASLGPSLEHLGHSEHLYRTLAETIPVAVIFRDASNRVVYVSDYAAELTGFSKEEIAAGAVLDALSDEDRDTLLGHWSRQESFNPREFRLEFKDGRAMWTLGASRSICDVNGVYVGKCNAFLDITDKKEAELSLLEKTTQISALLQAFPDIYFRLDLYGTILDYHAGRGSSLYVHPSEFLGHRVQDVLPEHVGMLVQDGLDHVAKTGQLVSLEYDISIGDQLRTFWARISPFGEEIVAVVQDISDRKKTERALEQAHEDLGRAFNLQREFFNTVTHEVRTPLTAIMGYTDMLLEGIAGPLNDQQRSMLEKTLASSDALLGIVNDVLEMSKLRAGGGELKPSACNPCKVVEAAVAAATPEAARKKLDITFECPRGGQTGIYDAEKLRVIVSNLITNAVKFTQNGGVHVIAQNDKSGLEVIVADTGIGIPIDKLDTIFRKFRQLEQPKKNKPTGFGLGLTIVSQTVERIGATLILSTAPGVGTAFTLNAPQIREDSE